MPIKFLTLRDDIKQAFLLAVKDLFWKEPELVDAVHGGADKIKGLPVFTITFDNLLAGGQLDAARPAGWRLFFHSAYHTVAGDVAVPDAAPPRIASLSSGQPLAAAIDSVLSTLSQPNLQDNEQYELRLLRLSSVYLEVCWLRSTTGSHDLFIPVISGLSAFEERGTYRTEDLFPKVLEAARRIKESGGN